MWSRGHKARGQGHKKNSRPRPRTVPLEAKDTDASVLKKKKRSSKIFFRRKRSSKFFSGDFYLKKPIKRSLQIFRKVFGVFLRNFNGSKIVLSSSRGQGRPYFNIITGGEIAPPVNFFAPPVKIFRAYVNDFV